MVARYIFNSSCDTKLNIELLYMKGLRGFPHQSFWIQLVSFQINKSTDLSKLIPIPLHVKNCYQWQHPLPPIYYYQYTTTNILPSIYYHQYTTTNILPPIYYRKGVSQFGRSPLPCCILWVDWYTIATHFILPHYLALSHYHALSHGVSVMNRPSEI